MKERFVFFSCPHFKLDPPAMRKDDYGELILRKIVWLQESALKLDAHLICLGDLFDKKHGTTLREVYELAGAIDHPFYTILGNHDIQAYNPRISTQPIGLLERAGKVIILESEEVLQVGSTIITCENYHADYDQLDTFARELPEGWREECEYHIHLTHGMLTDRHLLYDAVVAEDVQPHVKADLLVNGHNHEPWEYGNIYNVGSTARIAKDKNYLNKEPQCLVVDSKKRFIKWMPIPVEEDVWLDVVKRDTKTSEELDEFIKGLEGLDLAEDDDILAHLLEGYSENVRKKVYQYLGK